MIQWSFYLHIWHLLSVFIIGLIIPIQDFVDFLLTTFCGIPRDRQRGQSETINICLIFLSVLVRHNRPELFSRKGVNLMVAESLKCVQLCPRIGFSPVV